MITRKNFFNFLSLEVGKIETEGKQLVATVGDKVKCFPSRESCEMLSSCSHEEADTRIMVHVADAVKMGHSSVMIRTVDTDVLVLAVAIVEKLKIPELWI